ncbi:MAG TPA: Re/Si-specific NAD(P)(+) transhydrogenase subunit alpha [Pirellulaceae bacterium]|nr:Re/Si-specific NAD(P)(+) transhydrogenase subunit alpha [Pirellulaceae bacterium]
MLIAVPRESQPGERRVAATPQSVAKLIKLGYSVALETGAGEAACFADHVYKAAGASIAGNPPALWSDADIVLKVQPPSIDEISRMKRGAALISFVWPAQNEALLNAAVKQGISLLAMDRIPRISRAQKMDALSPMANIAGYRATVEAANEYGSFFTGQITAAGKVPPAKVMVIGAGVAGLSAIGAARGLGAIVRAFDTRLAVKDQVKSMGAEFLELSFEEEGEGAGGYAKVMSPEFIKAEMELFAEQAKEIDIIVTTALIPGKPAPTLITAEMVASMKPGSVIVDLAAEQGGNCELTRPGEKYVTDNQVTILGFTDFPSRLPTQSSTLYANNLVNLLQDLTPQKDGQLVLNMEDLVVQQSLATLAGELKFPPPPLPAPAVPVKTPSTPVKESPVEQVSFWGSPPVWGAAILAAILLTVGLVVAAPDGFVARLTIFVLACFVGWQVIWNVTPALHTPLMSVTNAISGIIIIGGMLQMLGQWNSVPVLLAAVAVLVASINVFGGFLVTQRMLQMFRR